MGPLVVTVNIFISEAIGKPWTTGLTWDPKVSEVVDQAITEADSALAQPNRVGCPQP